MNPHRPKRRSLRTEVVWTLLLATQLAGCGGGNGGTTSPPVTPNNPPPVTPGPTVSQLTVTGTVTDAPIANAVVTATVGGETFTATADANGNYSLDIEVEQDATDSFVTLSARGVGTQSYVEFTSLAGSFQSLKDVAGSDETLSNSENFATQITNVSTAEAVLLQAANGGQAITSVETLRSLTSSLNSQEVLDLATAIKLLVDDAANYPMPQGQTSLLALVSDAAVRGQFVNDTYEQNPTVFANTQSAIVTDTSLTRPITSAAVPATLTAAMLSIDADFSYNYSNRVASYTFDANGTGTAAAGSWNRETTWDVQGSTIRVTYGSTVGVTSYDRENCNGQVRQVEATYLSDGVTLALLGERVVAITETNNITYEEGCGLEPRTVTTTVARTILKDDDFQQIDAAELQGATQSIYVYDPNLDVVADIAQLGADGTGTTLALGKQFTWSVDATGRVIDVTFSDGIVAKFRSLRDIDAVTSDLFYEIVTPNGRRVDAGATVFADPELPLVFTPEAVPGRFYQFGIGLEGDPDTRLKSFRLRFDPDGTGAHEDDYIDDNGELATDDDSNVPYYALRWHIDGEDLVVQRTFNPQTQQDNCVFGEQDCVLYDERRMVPLARIDTRVYWMEWRRLEFSGITENTPATGLIRFYDYEPLSGAPVVGDQKSGNAVTGSDRKLRFPGKPLR